MRRFGVGREPSGVPSSKKARLNHWPSQAGPVQRARPALRGLFPALRAVVVAALPRQRREVGDHAAQEPAQPDRLAAAFDADAVHAVVPVAAAHQRQAVRAHAQAAVDGARARARRPWRCSVADASARSRRPRRRREWRRRRGRARARRAARVAGGVEVVRQRERQPQQVVGEMRAHAGAAGRVPPVLHVALGELARRASTICSRSSAGAAQASAIASCNWSRKPVAPPAW